jgi:hypothetical protein
VRQCYCDYQLGSSATAQPDSDCNYACSGNSSQACGAGNRLSVFSTKSTLGYNPGPAGWTSLGCYNDSTTARVLQRRFAVAAGDAGMSVLQCANACKTTGYTCSGVEYSSECYCGNKIQNGGAPVSSGCNMVCTGNHTEFCGGANRINIYQSARTPNSLAWAAQGCVTDNIQSRSLGVALQVFGGFHNMTVEACIQACDSAGYIIAGVEYLQEFWCDNQIRSGGVLAASTDCAMPCSGNNLETCGGSNRLSVYVPTSLNLPPASRSTSSSSFTAVGPVNSLQKSFTTSSVSMGSIQISPPTTVKSTSTTSSTIAATPASTTSSINTTKSAGTSTITTASISSASSTSISTTPFTNSRQSSKFNQHDWHG